MNRFWQLLRKEMRQALPAMGFFTGGMLLLFATIAYYGAPINSPRFFVALLPLQFVPLWILWRSVSVWRRDYSGNHMLLLLSLPVPGWMLVTVKLLAVVVEAAFYLVVIGVGFSSLWTNNSASTPLSVGGYGFLVWWAPYSILTIGLMILFPALLLQFAYLASRLTARLRGLVFAATLLVAWWLPFRVGGLCSHRCFNIQVAPLVGALLVLGGLFWLSARWVERDLEV